MCIRDRHRFVEIVEQNKEMLAQTLCAENGKPITEARAEIGNISIAFPAFAEHAKHFYGTLIPQGTEAGQETTLQLVTREPIGVVACIIPFNFPCDLYAVSYTHLDVYKRQEMVLAGSPFLQLRHSCFLRYRQYVAGQFY